MAKSTAYSNALLNMILNGTAIPGLTGTLYCALHTGALTPADAQNVLEADHPGYARLAVQRDGSAWVVTGNTAVPAQALDFAAASGAGPDVTHFSLGVAASGATMVLYSAPLLDSSGDPIAKPVTEGDSVLVSTASTITEV